ncbi:RICIN domain-containing protein [Streptomyces sp. WAC06614]|uniref:RICIN domain-containing protein n=1 Tax=Streptomyces sp. WAC06614 TaxID=2487416 RepID=UPI00163BC502|nr:RICIN domain-containing protein [Streptomyces sp. WAC06614]
MDIDRTDISVRNAPGSPGPSSRRAFPRRLRGALAATLLAAAAAVPLTASGAAAASPICLSGTLQYDYRSAEAGTAKPTVTKPVRNANVELWGAEKSTDTPRKLSADYQYTAVGDGGFNLCHTPATTTSMSSMWVRFRAESTKLWKVSDANGAAYTLDSPVRTGVTASTSLGTLKPSADTARAWHAFDTVNLLWWSRNNPAGICWSAHEANGNACTELNIRWTSSSTDGPYYDLANTVHLAAGDPDSEHTVLHEAGHFFMHRLYDGWWPTVTGCNPHYVERTSSDTCAWVEGFADSVAAYLLGDYRYVFPDGTSAGFTYSAGWHTGDRVQGNVDGSLLDLWNHVDGGWNGTIGVLTGHTASTFAQYFKTLRPAATPALSTTGTALTYLAAHTIDYGPTIVGDGRYHSLTNGGGLALEHVGQCAATTDVVAGITTYDPTRASQRWKTDANGDGTARIYDSCPDPLTLTAPAGAGAQVTLKAFNATDPYQKWRVTQNTSGTLTLTNPTTGYVLDSTGLTAGSAVTVTAAGNAPTQNWAKLS